MGGTVGYIKPKSFWYRLRYRYTWFSIKVRLKRRLPWNYRRYGKVRYFNWRFPFWLRWAPKVFGHHPRLNSWYYRKSFDWYRHPGNSHWKLLFLGDCDCRLEPGQRCFWCGGYRSYPVNAESLVPPVGGDLQLKEEGSG